MTNKNIISQLNDMSSLRIDRERIADLFLKEKPTINQLLAIVFNVDNKVCIKAAWALEVVLERDVTRIYPHLNEFINQLNKVQYGSAVRGLSKISKFIIVQNKKGNIPFFTNELKDKLAETAFDWMISDHKVAVKAYAMFTLYYLGKEIEWIHDELILIISNNMDSETAAYKSRGKITILAIEKFRNQKK